MATKKEWQEYFELMNERKPTNEEIEAALASGEFEADVVIEETVEVVETPVEQPAPESATSAPSKAAVDSEKIKRELNGFWGWVKDALKNPELEVNTPTPKYYGLSVLILSVLGFAITLTTAVYKIAAATGVFSLLDTAREYASATPSASGIVTRVFFYLVLLGVLIYGGILVATFVARRYVLQDTSFDFKRAVHALGRNLVPGLGAWLLAFVAALLGLRLIIVIGVSAALLVASFASSFTVFTSDNRSKMNHFYATLTSVIVVGAIMGLMMYIGGETLINNIMNYVQSVGSSSVGSGLNMFN